MKNCRANCHATGKNLWLRNGIYYFIMELPRVNGKRRYKCASLHTGNYYEACEKAKDLLLMNRPDTFFIELRGLLNQLVFEPTGKPTGNLGLGTVFKPEKRLSKKTPISIANKLKSLEPKVETLIKQNASLSAENRELLNFVKECMPAINKFLEVADPLSLAIHNFTSGTPAKPAPKPMKISEVLESMLLKKAKNAEGTNIRKERTIIRLLKEIGLTLDDDYSKFHDINTMKSISKNVIANDKITGDVKNKHLQSIKELATFGTDLDPDNYRLNVISGISEVDGTKKTERKAYKPFDKEYLLEIFNPKHDFFKDNPDMFFSCLIGLFTGARVNAAATLQYKDIKIVDGIECIEIIEDCPKIKKLKNEDSERIVPIHNQLRDVGFIDYVNRKKATLKASGTDFIFPRCRTIQPGGSIYYDKYPRIFTNFLKKLGIKAAKGRDGYSFHSFRNDLSKAMQKAHIDKSFVNKVGGWKGEGTVEQHYSDFNLTEIKAEMDKFGYDYLAPHFAAWKVIMSEK